MDPIEQYPTTGQPIIDTTLKDMLVYLRSALHRDMISFIAQVKSDVSEIGGRIRIGHVETTIGEYTAAHNELVDVHNDADDEIHKLKLKIAAIEDRSRRNNIKLCGVAQTVPQGDLRHKNVLLSYY